MEKMFQLAYSENIIVEEFYLTPPLMGIYICQKSFTPVIGLSTAIETLAEKRSIMAEELGHHFTSVGDCLPKQFYNYGMRRQIDKVEYKALRWAAYHLICNNEFLNAINEYSTPCELAEYFCVTPEIINLRIKLFKNDCSY